MAFLEGLLDRFDDYNGFESLCSEMLFRMGYKDINPIGGTGDKGRDAEEKVYSGTLGDQTIVFQFSVQETIESKVRDTLKKLKNNKIIANQVIFMFSRQVKTTTRDNLKEEAFIQYGYDIDIRDQRYIALRLGHSSFNDLAMRYFASEIEELRSLFEENKLFKIPFEQDEKINRCLVNLMFYARHPFADECHGEIIRQAIRQFLFNNEKGVEYDVLVQGVVDYLPCRDLIDTEMISRELLKLKQASEILDNNNIYVLSPEASREVNLDVADIMTSKNALIDFFMKVFEDNKVTDIPKSEVTIKCDVFFAELFKRYGNEVAHAILPEDDSDIKDHIVLDQETIDHILDITLSQWNQNKAKVFREGVQKLFSNPIKECLSYLNALSRSFILMQILNIDPQGINIQRERAKASVALLDTDIVLTAIVDGSCQQKVSRSIINLCNRVGIRCYVTDETVKEIVHKIEHSIEIFNDLGQPSFIPADKADLVSEIFLDIFYKTNIQDNIRSFGDYIQKYYNPADPREHVRKLISDILDSDNSDIASINKYYLIEQDEKVTRIQEAIETFREKTESYKFSGLYKNDALQMVVVEQNNREALRNNLPGRWYLVSGDKHILKAYIAKKDSFKIKPCIFPAYFLEQLRSIPESGADESTFGAILRSEGMLRGVGKNYISIIASLTKIGIRALEMPRERLLQLIEDMDRADFTYWLFVLRSSGEEINDDLREEIQAGLQRVIDESASRDQQLEHLKTLAGKAHDTIKLEKDKDALLH